MKKLFKFVGTVAALSAVAAAGVAVYRKFFASDEDFSDLDEDFDDEFEEEDLDEEASGGERGYVPLRSAAETEKEKAEDADETAKEAEEEKTESAADAAEETKETISE